MLDFVIRFRSFLLLGTLLLAQLLLVAYQVQTDGETRLLRVWAVWSVTSVERGLHGALSGVGGAWDQYVWLWDARQENESLRRERDRLQLENQQLQNAVARYGREEELQQFRQTIESQSVLAQVIGSSSNPASREFYINQGTEAGIHRGMAVIVADGIVGRIYAAYPNAALVLRIDDPEAAVGVLLATNRVRGVVRGTGGSEQRLDYVGINVEVGVGDTVLTSGDDRVYPQGLPVGRVSQVRNLGRERYIALEPFARLNRLDEVLVLTGGPREPLPVTPVDEAPYILMPNPAENPLTEATPPETPAMRPGGLGTYVPMTDADRLRRIYETIADDQDHEYGVTRSGSPDFNRGFAEADVEVGPDD